MTRDLGKQYMKAKKDLKRNPYGINIEKGAKSNVGTLLKKSNKKKKSKPLFPSFGKLTKQTKENNNILKKLTKQTGVVAASILIGVALIVSLKTIIENIGGGSFSGFGGDFEGGFGGHVPDSKPNAKVKNKIIDEANKQGVDPTLALAVAEQESGFNQNARSEAGAIGVFQLMPKTAKGLGVNPYDEDENIRGGVTYLKQMLKTFNGDVKLALTAYNAGPGNVKKYGGAIPGNEESQNYAKLVMSKQSKYNRILETPSTGPSSYKGHTITSQYGEKRATEIHRGVDFAYYMNEPVYAFYGGTIWLVGWMDGFGKSVVIEDKYGYRHVYGHLNGYAKGLHVNKKVNAGDLIGYAGNTGRSGGAHLHYGVWIPGARSDTLDGKNQTVNPIDYLNKVLTESNKQSSRNVENAKQNAPTTKPKPQNKQQNKTTTKPKNKKITTPKTTPKVNVQTGSGVNINDTRNNTPDKKRL